MSTKAIFVFCAQALFIQCISSQCIPGTFIDDFGLSPYGYGPVPFGYAPYDYAGCVPPIAPTTGGGFLVTSFSPISPTGVSVFSENGIEGVLSVFGELPFLACVALDGALPSVGAGGINYGCGNGNVAIISEGLGIGGPVGPAYPAALGYGPGLAGPGIGFGPGLVGPAIGYGPAVAGFGYGGPGYGIGCGCIY